jgi:phosphatidylglycerophosphate synthase
MQIESRFSTNRRPLKLRSIQWMRSLAQGLAESGVSPNFISVVGLIVSITAGLTFFLTRYYPDIERLLWLAGLMFILLRIFANTLDGMVAIEGSRASPVGVLYNEAPDRLSDCIILIGAGYASGGSIELGYGAALLSLFVAYVRTLTQSAGALCNFCGPMAKGHRLIAIMIATLYSGLMPDSWQFSWGPTGNWGIISAILAIIILGGILTAGKRLFFAGRYLRSLK